MTWIKVEEMDEVIEHYLVIKPYLVIKKTLSSDKNKK